MREWMKKHMVAFVVICFLVLFALVGVPLLINVLFKINTGIKVLQAEWSAGDMLGYYGAVLSFLGTVVLGALALYQNHIIKEETDKRAEEADKRAALFEKWERNEIRPRFRTHSMTVSEDDRKISFYIENISENIAYEIRFYDLRIHVPGKTIQKAEWKVSTSGLGSKEEFCVNIDADSVPLKEAGEILLMVNMKCKDKYLEAHEYYIGISYSSPDDCDHYGVLELLSPSQNHIEIVSYSQKQPRVLNNKEIEELMKETLKQAPIKKGRL